MASETSTAAQRTALGQEINELVSQARGLAKQAANKDSRWQPCRSVFSRQEVELI